MVTGVPDGETVGPRRVGFGVKVGPPGVIVGTRVTVGRTGAVALGVLLGSGVNVGAGVFEGTVVAVMMGVHEAGSVPPIGIGVRVGPPGVIDGVGDGPGDGVLDAASVGSGVDVGVGANRVRTAALTVKMTRINAIRARTAIMTVLPELCRELL